MTTQTQKVLLLGATGQTGGSILEGLVENKFQVEALVRPASAEKPKVKKLLEKNIKIHLADINGPVEELVRLLSAFDTVISAIDANSQLAQLNLATAAKMAGVSRFVPCAFTIVCPAGDVMLLRDEKEHVYQHIKKLFLPFTVIDVGFWYQLSYPVLPSGRVDYAALMPSTTIHGDGEAMNILTDLRDIGRFVAKIIADPRTLNKYVYTWGDVMSENQIFTLMEELSGEVIDRKYESFEDIEASVQEAKKAYETDAQDPMGRFLMFGSQYAHSKYVRSDNRPEFAKYLGYLDARELYPDFQPRRFRNYVLEVLDGKGIKPYPDGLPAK